MTIRAPLTICVATLAFIVTAGSTSAPAFQLPLTSWLVHGGWIHLFCDLVPWLVVGTWVERTRGTRRLLLWLCAAVVTTTIAHAWLYSDHLGLYGLSAIVYFIASAALIRPARDAWWARGVLGLMALRLVWESFAADASLTGSLGGLGSIESIHGPILLAPVPLVHLAAAMVGAALGLVDRLRSQRTDDNSAALAGSRAGSFGAA